MLSLTDLARFQIEGRSDLQDPPHVPVIHPRLRNLELEDPDSLFAEIRKADLLLHHPYHDYETSILRFLESAVRDPKVLALKLTIYRTSSCSPHHRDSQRSCDGRQAGGGAGGNHRPF